jgi:hypothetical protein
MHSGHRNINIYAIYFLYCSQYHTVSETTFVESFRMSRAVFDRLVHAVTPLFEASVPRLNPELDVKIVLGVTLYYLAHNQTYRELAMTFGISASYVHELARNMMPCICTAINNMPGLAVSMVNMRPEDWNAERLKWMGAGGFSDGRYRAFNGCVGAVDGTLINIRVVENGVIWDSIPWFVPDVCVAIHASG